MKKTGKPGGNNKESRMFHFHDIATLSAAMMFFLRLRPFLKMGSSNLLVLGLTPKVSPQNFPRLPFFQNSSGSSAQASMRCVTLTTGFKVMLDKTTSNEIPCDTTLCYPVSFWHTKRTHTLMPISQ